MEKSLILRNEEFKEELVKLINKSELPAFILKTNIENVYKQLSEIEMQQLELARSEYEEAQIKEKKKGEKNEKKD